MTLLKHNHKAESKKELHEKKIQGQLLALSEWLAGRFSLQPSIWRGREANPPIFSSI